VATVCASVCGCAPGAHAMMSGAREAALRAEGADSVRSWLWSAAEGGGVAAVLVGHGERDGRADVVAAERRCGVPWRAW